MMENNKRKRIIYIDILNIISIFAVVLLHHNGIVRFYSASRAWKTSLIVETAFFWAAPVFLMISGSMLMGYRKKYDTKTFFKKRFTKVLIPFAFWTVVMTIWKVHIKQLVIDKYSIVNLVNIILNYQEEPIYYFGFVIIGIYLTMPLLSNLAEDKYRNSLWFTVLLWFIFNSTLPVICALFKISYNGFLKVQIGDYLIFVLLGYLLSTKDLERKYRIVLYVLGFLSVVFRYVVTYYLSVRDGFINRTLFEYYEFHSVLLACAVFVFIKNVNWDRFIKSEKISKLLGKVASCSFGIYLIHIIIMHYERKFCDISIYSWQWRTIGAICTYFISLGIILILKKIPVVKRIVA